MSKVVFTNNFPQVARHYENKKQQGLRKGGQEFFRVTGGRTPKKSKHLRRMTSLQLLGTSAVVLVWSAKYAAVQNAGHRRGARGRFRKYTTPNTGSGFVQHGMNFMQKRFAEFFR